MGQGNTPCPFLHSSRGNSRIASFFAGANGRSPEQIPHAFALPLCQRGKKGDFQQIRLCEDAFEGEPSAAIYNIRPPDLSNRWLSLFIEILNKEEGERRIRDMGGPESLLFPLQGKDQPFWRFDFKSSVKIN